MYFLSPYVICFKLHAKITEHVWLISSTYSKSLFFVGSHARTLFSLYNIKTSLEFILLLNLLFI